MSFSRFHTIVKVAAVALILLLASVPSAEAADVISNGAFPSDITTNWTNLSSGSGSTSWDGTIGGVANGSMKGSVSGRNLNHTAILSQSIGTINATDDVLLSLYWYKASTFRSPAQNNMIIRIIKPSGDSADIWTNSTIPAADVPTSGTVTDQIVSSDFNETGIYTIRLYGYIGGVTNNIAAHQLNFDDIVLDVSTPLPNNAPTVVAGATTPAPVTVNKVGTNTTTISTDFTDVDQPGIGAFNVTLKIKDPSESETTIANALANGGDGGNMIITDNGGGSYTAAYTYDPLAGQATGAYDLYFAVSDGTDNAIDPYASNSNELTVFQQNVPTVTVSATSAAPAAVNKVGANTTTISTDFNDIDQPGIGAFNVTFKIRKPDNANDTILVNNQPNGGGGLTITDNTGGSYTASFSYDPPAGQMLGDYDLYFEVTDGSDLAVDGYGNNSDELMIYQQTPPTIAAGAIQASTSPVNRYGANSTVLSADFTDVDQPGINAFAVTFKIREPNDVTELTLVNAQVNGAGGVTITDNTGGSYTASYTYDPGAAQTTGDYDLYFEVSDGTDNAIDNYDPSNLNELNIYQQAPSTVTPGATISSKATVNRVGTDATVLSTVFTDIDQSGVGAFNVTFKIKDATETEYTLVNNQSNGSGGVTITDDGGGNYTASYSFDPIGTQPLGDYDIYFEVSDGPSSAIDPYVSNDNEFSIYDAAPNNPPTVVAGATVPSPVTVNRYGANTTVISTDFIDVDEPIVNLFNVTYKIKDASEVETIIANALSNGGDGGNMVITNNGSGSYTATYTYNPDDAQTLSAYDLYFEVSDGTDNSIDPYVSNDNELTIFQQAVPTVVAGATASSKATVNRVGTDATVLSTSFTDLDVPGVGAFNVTFKIKDNTETEYTLVNNQPNGGGGLTIADDGGGNYTASYSYDPTGIQPLGDYDIYFEVTDGSDNAIDPYISNDNEFSIFDTPPNNAPTVVAGATGVAPASVNRVGPATTTISTTFTDSDEPGVGAFTVTFKIKDDTETEYTLVNNQPNGAGGLTITDGGGGSYTASYTYDPGGTQAVSLYDLYFEVSDGFDNAIDTYVDNTDELDIVQQIAPTIANSAPIVSVTPVNRFGAGTTVISSEFIDPDQPGVGAFNCTIKIRKPNDIDDTVLVNNQPNGGSGLTITDGGGGIYTASFTYDPPAGQELGLYDLYFEVTDGIDNAIDGYVNNLNELEIIEQQTPTIIAGATAVSVSPVNRYGTNATIISASFSDLDLPGIGAFNCTIKIRKPNDVDDTILVNNQPNGGGGLTIVDDGGGDYTASFTYNPPDDQDLGFYDLYFEVSDGVDVAVDDYTDNLNELEIDETLPAQAPQLIAGTTYPTVSPVDRLGSSTTVLTTSFTDGNQPANTSFTITYILRYPDNVAETTLVNNLGDGSPGLTVTDDGGGSYTARYIYNPPDDQILGLYDIHFEVDDNTGQARAVDDSTNNLDELQITEVVTNDPPSITAGATVVSISPINRFGANTTVVSVPFTDPDESGVSNYTVTFKIRHSDLTEYTLINDLHDGVGGLTITDHGAGSYTAQWIFNPDISQPTGFYDLYCVVRDRLVSDTDDYTDNAAELEIVEILPNNPPQVNAGDAIASKSPVNRLEGDVTNLSISFYDADVPGVNAFTVTLKIRLPNNINEVVVSNDFSNGMGGLTIIELGAGSGVYKASITYDPADAQTLGFYDIYAEVSDGTDSDIDDYTNNLDELEIIEFNTNDAPSIVAGNTSVSPGSVARAGTATTDMSVTFTDPDQPGISAFFVVFEIRAEYSATVYRVSDSLQHGQSGMAIVDNGGGSYTATISYDPPDNALLAYYDLQALISDGELSGLDGHDNNSSELLITSAGDNAPPIVSADATYATPAAVERVGVNPTTIMAPFYDVDDPGVSAYNVTFKLRDVNNVDEIVLATDAGNGASGVTITQDGGGVYTASVSWEPLDGQNVGFYDLYFWVREGIDTTFDPFTNNLDELQVYDAVSNNAPTLVAANTVAIPNSVNRIGTGYSMIQSVFADVDRPGSSAFTVTIKVRNPSNGEVTVVNAAKHGEQGLRIRHTTGSNYEASVLWDPDVADETGTYDLYFYVEDNVAAGVADDYTNNLEELTVTSAALLGDGNLLHRSADATTCGGPASACHNLPLAHNGQDCYVCHTPHGSANIFLVRDTILTPSSGLKEVVFKTLGVGDPDNSPDPVEGDDNHGAMADDANAVQTEVCEVCHTTAKYYRNDDSHVSRDHNNVQDCVAVCHPHDGGFTPSAGAESGGGQACACHSSILNTMDSTSTMYRHILANDDPNYSPGASGMYATKNCLSCHVDHDIFRPDLNVGFGQRARNLRVDWAVDPVQGSATALSNSDYSSSGNGGICISCHGNPTQSCTGCHSAHVSSNRETREAALAESSFSHVIFPKSDFDAATSGHNYNVPSTFGADGSTFNANCTKCHNDNMASSYQNSTHTFGGHGSPFEDLLDSAGIASAADPLEEDFCFKCHSTTSNPNAGSNLDYFGVRSITNPEALDIEAAYTRTYTHPTLTYSGRHSMVDSAQSLADGNRHAECGDCHDPHAAQQGTHDGSNNLVSNALKGVWGVEPTFGTPPTPTDNGNLFASPTGYTRLDPATKEYQICLKCHSNYTTLPSGSRNLAEEINPNYPSTHGIVQAGDNPFCNTTTMNLPWGSSKIAWCSDCHCSDNSSDPEGPHGSNLDRMLVATIVSDGTNGTPLCDVCHKATVYWTGLGTASDFTQHPGTQGQHKVAPGCFACHMWGFSSTGGLGISTTDWPGTYQSSTPSLPPVKIWAHGQNRKWVYNEQSGAAGTQQAVANFINGYIANEDHTGNNCWSEVCKVHSNKSY